MAFERCHQRPADHGQGQYQQTEQGEARQPQAAAAQSAIFRRRQPEAEQRQKQRSCGGRIKAATSFFRRNVITPSTTAVDSFSHKLRPTIRPALRTKARSEPQKTRFSKDVLSCVYIPVGAVTAKGAVMFSL
jgi:hypothetical protein